MDFGQGFFQKDNPDLSGLFIRLAEDRKPIFLDGYVIVDNDFFNYSVYSKIYFIDSFGIFLLPSENLPNYIGKLGKGGERR